MVIESTVIESQRLTWTLRCPTSDDAYELSRLRIEIDGETEFLDREPGEGFLSAEDFKEIIDNDSAAERNLFLVVVVSDKIVGYTRCEGNTLKRFRHKAEFGICILKNYCGLGIGGYLLERVLQWAQAAGISKITLKVVQTNSNAVSLYKKYGFTQEGLLINDRIHSDGNYYNTLIMGKIL